MVLYGSGAGMEDSRPEHDIGLQAVTESFWQLGLGGGGEGAPPYPERPGQPECTYYLRTGVCGYGDRCRYNHPRDRSVSVVNMASGLFEYPERVGQPACQYFLRTGTCKFGLMCKYHHPKTMDRSVLPIPLNYFGYPLRPGEKECAYYVRTGQCKFGAACKLHHPQPSNISLSSSEPSFYPTMDSSVSTQQYENMPSWRVARAPVLPSSYMAGPYGPVIVPSGVVPVSGWNPYQTSSTSALPPGAVQAGTYLSSYVPSNNIQKECLFPERPGQPDCQYYLRNGDCKFGSLCRYHHPPGWSVPKLNCLVSPIGLPIRPGAPPCLFYTRHGVCKFGPTCKFDHPMGLLNYSPSSSSLTEVPVGSYPLGFSVTAFTPLASSPDLEFASSTNTPLRTENL